MVIENEKPNMSDHFFLKYKRKINSNIPLLEVHN